VIAATRRTTTCWTVIIVVVVIVVAVIVVIVRRDEATGTTALSPSDGRLFASAMILGEHAVVRSCEIVRVVVPTL
jgi:preprotein translocase subunit SecG